MRHNVRIPEVTPKFIFIVGGVMSSVGKGVSTASIGRLLQSRGFKVTIIKADPYLNIDAGTMNPVEHGEVFVTMDGDETDQDIGNYERFLNQNIYSVNYMTLGRVFKKVLDKERKLEYGGKCVEFFYHTPLEIINLIKKAQKENNAEITLIEVGGTIGEYQNILFLEAGRMMRLKNPDNVLFIMVSYLPIPSTVGEMKTKPTQNAVRLLNSSGIQPDIILGRSEKPLDRKRKEKIALMCNMHEEDIISAPDCSNIYEVPFNFKKEKLDIKILTKLNLKPRKVNMKDWRKWLDKVKRIKKSVKIGIAGKYFTTGKFILADSYISVIEALKFSAWHLNRKLDLVWLDVEEYEKNPKSLKELFDFDGIVVPGGFGKRGVEGKIKVAQFCRENNIPYFGLCLGMQIMAIEFARNVLKLKNAHSEEFNTKTKYPIIHIIPAQKEKLKQKDYGGSMRLGGYKCLLDKNSISYRAYLSTKWIKPHNPVIVERHRHRYEFNNKYRSIFEEKGAHIAGVNTDQDLVEIIEIKNHSFMVGCQFHPEFQARPLNPHPLFTEFIKIAIKQS